MTEKKKQPLMKTLLKYVVPLIISVGLCYLLFTGIDFGEMMSIIKRECDFTYIAIGLVVAVLSHIFRAFRWGIQLRALGIDAPKHALIYSIFGTYAVNLVFPRLGEVWRSGYIAQRQDAPFATVFGSMVADRLADTVTVLLITAATFLMASGEILSFLSANGESYAAIARILSSPWLWGGVVLCIAAVWIFMVRKSSNRTVVKIQAAARELWQGFAVIVKMPGKGRWLLFTLGVWGCYFFQMYICFYAFPFTADVLAHHGVLAALVTFVLGSISMGVPSNGGIGPWQWAVIFALGFYAVGKAQAGAFANLVLGCNTLLLIVLGIITFAGIALDRKRTKSIINKNTISKCQKS
ncbi:MAG: flippase-like domain-containing protein [Muribaculaceae bacterium]|nr:flippase-like domain-containing protein [Muribaculaceae bacterium]